MSQCWTAVVAAWIVLGLISAGAQAQQPTRPVGPVAILDLTYIFKNHGRFQSMMEGMRKEVEAAEQRLAAERDAVQAKARELEQTYKKGSPEYKQVEETLIKAQNDLQLKVGLQKKQFLEQEAKIYFTAYQEVIDQVRYYSEQNGIALVLRFNGDPIDRNDPQEVLKELNKSVLYSHRSIDITPIILEKLNPATAGRAPLGPPTTGGVIPSGPVNLPPRQGVATPTFPR